MTEEKSTLNDSSADTLKSSTRSTNEKEADYEATQPEPVARTATRTSTHTHNTDLKKVTSAKDVQENLQRIMTSGEGVEYPTGMRLGLISLALCLSVFLMALVS